MVLSIDHKLLSGIVCFQRQGPLVAHSQCPLGSTDKIPEQRMWAVGTGGKFRMELYSHHPGMSGNLAYLDQLAVGRNATGDKSCLAQSVFELIVELKTMAVPLINQWLVICSSSTGARDKMAGVQSQSHGTALLFDFLLFIEKVDYWMRGILVELSGICPVILQHAARELYDHDMHTQTQTEIRYVVLASIPGSLNFTFNASISEPSGYHYSVHTAQHRVASVLLQILRLNPYDIHVSVMIQCSMA